ncbi:MAG TPA: DUF1127 domain-containing protein [Acetobacteraceae bacterium]|nr:DUF1127 domain-containing protein [Acetobacteraceae bacterium]
MSVAIFETFRPPRQRLHGMRKGFAMLRQRFLDWRRDVRARRELLAADPRMLADIGISRAEADFRALSGPLDWPD